MIEANNVDKLVQLLHSEAKVLNNKIKINMAVLVYAESWNGSFKKATFEAVSYAAQLANKIETEVIAITIAHQGNANELGNYGANKVLTITDETFNTFNNQSYANAIVAASNYVSAEIVVISNTNNGKAIAPIIAAKRKQL